MATTFHPFPLLPYELRAQIWEHAASEPRTVEVRIDFKQQYPALAHLSCDQFSKIYEKYNATVPVLVTGLTPVPALMHACHESRAIGSKEFYQRACTEIVPGLIEVVRERNRLEEEKRERNRSRKLKRQEKEERARRAEAGLPTVEEEEEARLKEKYGELEEYVPEERYIYVNWDSDTLSLGGPNESCIRTLKPVAHLVQRFKYARRYSDEWYVRGEISELSMFKNLKELHIVALDGFQQWRWASEEDWPCEIENVILYEDNSQMSLVELDEMFKEWDKEYYRQLEEEEAEARRREEAQQSGVVGSDGATNV